ncbi:MAG: flagellar motor switch protein FliM [Candidatus Methylomirabilis sp.]|nr:flagellar motor switch protein FliM [Deltaproteobacteria bacterium]
MDGVLSQDEVNALLKGISTLEVDAPQSETAEAALFDFTNQERIIRGRMPTLEIVMDKLARALRQSLSSIFSRSIFVNVSTIGMRKFGSFIKSLPVPSSMHIFKMPPLKGVAMVYMEARLVFSLIDYFFGGPGAPTMKIEGRDFTPIESRLIGKIVEKILSDFEAAMACVQPTRVGYVRSEINPLFAAIVPPSDLVVKIDLEVEMEHCTGQIVFCIPYSLFEPIKERLTSSFQSERLEVDYRWTRTIRKILGEAPLDLQVNLGTARISLEQLRDLKVGDVITLEKPVTEPLELTVQGFPRFKVRPGEMNGSKAVEVVGRADA